MKFKHVFINTSFYFFASIIRAVFSLAINPLIAMNMTHYDYALTGFYTSFNSLLLPFLSLMYGQYYSRKFFKLKTKDERDELASDLIVSRLIFNLFEIIFVLVAFTVYAKTQNIEFPIFPYAIITFSSIMFNSIYTFYLLTLKMRKNAKHFFIISLYHALLLSGLSLFLVVALKLGALGKLLSVLLTAVIFAGFVLPKLLKKIRINKEVTIDALKFCWPLMIAGSLGYFFTGFDRALLVKLDDNIQLGLYNIALQISGFLMIFQTSLNQTFQPDIFEAVAKNNKKKLLVVLGGINLLNIIPIVIFILIAPFLIDILTAGRYTEAYTFARILSLRNLTAGMYHSMAGIIIAYGYSKISLINKVIGSILSIFMFKYLITNYAFYGAAWGQVLSFMGMTIIGIIVLFIKKRKKFIKRIKK